MNKYEAAFNIIQSFIVQWADCSEEINIVKEIINRSIPKKPIVMGTGDPICPTCFNRISYPYCCHNNVCRQALDWSSHD